jgi:hypothetical protein
MKEFSLLFLLVSIFTLFSCGKGEREKEEQRLLAARLAGILTYKEMPSVTPANLFVFEKYGVVLQRSEEHPYWWSYADETNAFNIEVKFQQEDSGKWEYLKTTIIMKDKNMDFFTILIETMEKATGQKGVESHFHNTKSYTWPITPKLNASVNGYEFTPEEMSIKMVLSYPLLEDVEYEENPEEVSDAQP